MTVFGICQYFGRYFGHLNKKCRYSVFQSPNGKMKYIQVLIENTTVTVFIQKIDCVITVIFEKSTINQNPEKPDF